MMNNRPTQPDIATITPLSIHPSKSLWLISIAILTSFIAFIVFHLSDAKRFIALVAQAQPAWLIIAVIAQAGTYLAAGFIWQYVLSSNHHSLSLVSLAKLAVEKMSIDQLVPAGGMSGNLLAFHIMQRLGLPRWLALQALLVDTFSYYIAYAVIALTALIFLKTYHDITPVIRYLLAAFLFSVTIAIVALTRLFTQPLAHLPQWLYRIRLIYTLWNFFRPDQSITKDTKKLLLTTSLLNIAIFMLDGLTLWATTRATGYTISITEALVAFIVASIAGSVSLLPGGIGGFEAGAIITLALFGIPTETALTSTLIFRGLTLWIPLVPGAIITHHDLTYNS